MKIQIIDIFQIYLILMPWLSFLKLLSLILGMKRNSEDILGSETG
jgi:hypothetical protein